jgi:hypothetical protein
VFRKVQENKENFRLEEAHQLLATAVNLLGEKWIEVVTDKTEYIYSPECRTEYWYRLKIANEAFRKAANFLYLGWQ